MKSDNLEEFADPANYDLEQGPLAQARIAFWRRMAAQFGGPVLELCCGTGLVAIPVAAMGLSVTGVDLAAPMLAHARAKAAQADVDTHWIEADVRSLVLPRRFGFVILTGNAFQAFLAVDDQRALLATVRRQLAPPELDYVDAAGHRVVVTSSQRWDAAAQVMHWTTFRRWTDPAGTPHERRTNIACRFTSPDEIEDLLDAAGFDIVAQYGDWNFAPFRASGERLITLCRRRAGA